MVLAEGILAKGRSVLLGSLFFGGFFSGEATRLSTTWWAQRRLVGMGNRRSSGLPGRLENLVAGEGGGGWRDQESGGPRGPIAGGFGTFSGSSAVVIPRLLPRPARLVRLPRGRCRAARCPGRPGACCRAANVARCRIAAAPGAVWPRERRRGPGTATRIAVPCRRRKKSGRGARRGQGRRNPAARDSRAIFFAQDGRGEHGGQDVQGHREDAARCA